MTDREPTNADLRDEVYKLADACVHEALSDEDYRRLEELLSRDETARLYYVDYLHDAYQLHRMAALASADDECAEVGTFAEGPFSEIYFNAAPLAPAHEPGGGWQAVISYCSQVGPLSYMAAAVITCALLLVGWACKISHHRHFDVAAGPTYESPLNDRRELVFVGRISGMKDCRWSNPDTGTYLGASAPQGREYALASGLIEITYKSGARVILEGPCTYKVESSACGFLERGKLTANIRTQSSKLKAQTSEHSPLSILHPTLFAVRTPTAIVADLGTEFGVEVDANGETTSHVFQGSVQVQIL
ncbi:MAG: hypothetical protein JW959_08520, partial [Pirellulales bacterium]|nr:hypothetical protein [Pirellulales bacterium]